jgi:sirohydrochlorin cobaltochelatase
MDSVILLAHGARDPAWAAPLERLRAEILAREPAIDVRLAFLEFMAPTLLEALDAVVAAGRAHVRVVPVFLAQGGHVKRDVPRILQTARMRHPCLVIDLQDALGEAQSVIAAMATAVLYPD